MEFISSFEHTLDDKGRLALPREYRDAFAEGAVLTLRDKRCIEVYTPAGYRKMYDRFAAEPPTTLRGRRVRRRFNANSWRVEKDAQGRIQIRKELRELAGINGGAVIVAGCGEWLEIWTPEGWQREMEAVMAEFSEVEPE